MKTTKPKPLSDYNLITVYVRGDKKFARVLKSKAALTGQPLADCVREWLEFAIDNADASFCESGGNDTTRSGNT
jgi:hypothetical protein